MNTDGGALSFESLMENDRFIAAVNENERRIKGMSRNIENEGGKIDLSFKRMGKFATDLIGPVTAVTAAFKFQQLAREAYEFEKAFGMAMREVQTISTAVQENLEGISDQIINMAANGPDDALKLAKAYYQIVSAGYDGAEGLKLLGVSSKAATAGITETAVAADGLTTVLNAWGLQASEAENVADVMFKTVERGKTTFGELASTIAQVAPLAAANNISFREIFASLQTITKQGTPTAQAMTQIRSAIINMNKVLGDGWSATMTFQEGLNEIARRAGGSQNKLKALIPDIEGVNGVLALTGEKARGAADDLDETTRAAGAMQKAYGTMMTEADNKWSAVHNKWTRELKGLGETIKESSTGLATLFDALLSRGVDLDKDLLIYDLEDRVRALKLMGESTVAAYTKAGLMSNDSVRNLYGEYLERIQDYANSGLGDQKLELNAILSIENEEEQLTALKNFLSELGKAQEDIGDTEFVNEEQQKAALKVRADLWAEVKTQAQDAIAALEKSAGTGGESETQVRTLKDMLKEAEALKDELGKVSAEEDAKVLAKLNTLYKEIREYYSQLKELRNDIVGDKLAPVKPVIEQGSIDTTKDLEKEIEKLKGSIKSTNAEAENLQQAFDIEELERLSDVAMGLSGILWDLADSLRDTNPELAKTVDKLSETLYGVSTFAAGYATGNPVAMAAGGVQTLSSFIDSEVISDTETYTRAIEDLRNAYDDLVFSMERALGVDKFTSKEEASKNIKLQIDALRKAIKAEEEATKKTTARLFGLWGPKIKLGEESATDSAKIEEYNDAIRELEQSLVDLEDQMVETWTGTSADDFSSQLVKAASDIQDAFGAVSQNINEMLRDAISDALKRQYVEQPLSDLLSKLAKDMDSDSDNILDLTGEEASDFSSGVKGIMGKYTEAFKAMQESLGEAGIDIAGQGVQKSGLSGSIRRDLTEETAGELAGIWRKYSDDTRRIKDYTAIGVENLISIKENTANTVSELQKAVSRLDQIVTNTKPSQTSRDMGV